MTPATTSACPKCQQPIQPGSKFCASCGLNISGPWSKSGASALGSTIAVEVDPNADILGQMLSEATLGDYDIFGELGRGGMAAVYLGHDISLNRKVAIKTMLPELVSRGDMVERFKREAQTAAGLNHPHIIQIYSVKSTKQLVYFVMKFIEGRSLESVITDKGRVPLAMAQTILGQVGSALDYAHRRHVVHRDIKPANIMIDEDGWAIVTDFGIAKLQEAQNLTATGTAIGTPHYMSPEQFHNKAITGLSDQYSLGVVLYEMLTGKKPFDGGTYAEIITQHLFEPVPDVRELAPDTPAHVVDVVNKMLAKEPAERFPDLDTAIHALGTPSSKKEGDVVRTQMISLAKSGPQKKIRASVPMSPIPPKKKAVAPTAVEPKAAVKQKKSGGTGWAIAAVLLLAALGAGGFYYYTKSMKPAESVAARTDTVPAIADSQPSTATASADSVPTETKAEAAPAPAINADSLLKLAMAKLEKQRRDSIRRAQAEERRLASLSKTTKTTSPATERIEARGTTTGAVAVQQSASTTPVPPPAPPEATPTGAIKIGSPTPGAYLYVNGTIDPNQLSSVRTVPVPAGSVRVSIKADKCEPWDSIVTVPANTTVTIGRRFAKCP